MRTRAQWLMVALAAMLAGAAVGAVGAAAADDDKALDGTWKTVSIEVNGEAVKDEDRKEYQVVFAGDKFTVTLSGQTTLKGEVQVDPAAVPARIDLKIAESADSPDDAGKTLAGIYQLTGDEMKWCFGLPPGAERPKEFSTEQDSGRVLATLKRQKKQ